MLEKIDTKYFKVPNWRNYKGLVHFREVSGDWDNNSALVQNLNTDSKRHRKILEKIPYLSIVALDEEMYGRGLYLAKRAVKKITKINEVDVYDILTMQGVVIGRFFHDCISELHSRQGYEPSETSSGKGVCLPTHNVYLDFKNEEKAKRKSPDLGDIILKYCSKNVEAIEHIPQSTYQKFPKLREKFGEFGDTKEGGMQK